MASSTAFPGRLFDRMAARRWGWPLATAALATLLGLPSLITPLWLDNNIFALIAQTIRDGGLPYADAWDNKPPAIFLLFAAALSGPFDLTRDVRVFDLLWTAATVAALVALGRRWWGAGAGVAAGLLYGLGYWGGSSWEQLAQPDSFIALPLVLALLCHDWANGRARWLLAAGALLGFAFQLRFIVALLTPLLPLTTAGAGSRRQRARRWAWELGWLAGGAAAVQAAFAFWLAVGGALDDYVEAMLSTRAYVRLGGPWNGPDGPTVSGYLQALRLSPLFWGVPRLLLTLPAVLGGFWGVFVSKDRQVGRLVALLVLAYVGVALQAKFFWYHFLYLLPLLALLSGWTLARLAGALRARLPLRWAVVGVAIAVLALGSSSTEFTGNVRLQWQQLARYVVDADARGAYLRSFRGQQPGARVAATIRATTKPDETILVWGFDPLPYLLSERPPASRFIHVIPLMSDWGTDAWRDEFLRDLERNRPAYVIVDRARSDPWITGHTVEVVAFIDQWPAFRRWLDERYQPVGEDVIFAIYRRR